MPCPLAFYSPDPHQAIAWRPWLCGDFAPECRHRALVPRVSARSKGGLSQVHPHLPLLRRQAMDTAVDRLPHPARFKLLHLAYRDTKHRYHGALVRPVLDGRLGYRVAPRLRRHNVSYFVRPSICIGRFSPAMRRMALAKLSERLESDLLRARE